MSEMTVEQAYKVMQAHCGIEVGDKVKVLRGFKQGEMGTDGSDISSSDLVGDIGVVTNSCSSWFHLKMDKHIRGKTEMHYPFFCLELVEKAKPELPADVSFTDDGLTVRGTFLSKDTIRRNLDL